VFPTLQGKSNKPEKKAILYKDLKILLLVFTGRQQAGFLAKLFVGRH
jgi:hypothetical protein